MDAALTIPEVERLVAEQAKRFDRTVTPDFVHVYENPDSAHGETLVVQVAAHRPADRKGWIELRLRFSQAIRDMLIQHGDDRYPVLEIFGREEWAGRNG